MSKYRKMPFVTEAEFGRWIAERRPIFMGHKVYTWGFYSNWPVRFLFQRTLRSEDQKYKAIKETHGNNKSG